MSPLDRWGAAARGGHPIHDLPDIGVDLNENDDEDRDYTTVADLVLARRRPHRA